MTKVTYIGEPGGSTDAVQYGYTFAGGKAVEVEDDRRLAKFRGNAHFKVTEKEARQEKDETGLKAVHNGGGRFVIKRDGVIVKEGLNKVDADVFNAMSDEDRAEYAAE